MKFAYKNLIITASSRTEALEKISALTKNERNHIDDVIYGSGFFVKEFDVGDNKTVALSNIALDETYAQVLLTKEDDDEYRIGLDLPGLEDEWNTTVVKSKKTYTESEIKDKLREVGKAMEKAEKEYMKDLKEYRKRLKSLI